MVIPIKGTLVLMARCVIMIAFSFQILWKCGFAEYSSSNKFKQFWCATGWILGFIKISCFLDCLHVV